MENALIIFANNSEKNELNPTLVEDLGEEKSLQIYKQLLAHTREITYGVNCSHFVFYSSYVHINDVFDDDHYTKFVQQGDSNSEKILHALNKVFDLGCKKVCLINCNYSDLQTTMIEDAFARLEQVDVVLGPVAGNGYYLVGLKQNGLPIFESIDRNGEDLYNNILGAIKKNGLAYDELEVIQPAGAGEVDSVTG